MKFMIDECTGPAVAKWLKKQGYDVISVYDKDPGISDIEVLEIACEEGRIVITNDKDFGDIVFRQNKNHFGVILLRMDDDSPANKIQLLEKVFLNHSHEIEGNFIVATEKIIRVIVLKTNIH